MAELTVQEKSSATDGLGLGDEVVRLDIYPALYQQGYYSKLTTDLQFMEFSDFSDAVEADLAFFSELSEIASTVGLQASDTGFSLSAGAIYLGGYNSIDISANISDFKIDGAAANPVTLEMLFEADSIEEFDISGQFHSVTLSTNTTDLLTLEHSTDGISLVYDNATSGMVDRLRLDGTFNNELSKIIPLVSDLLSFNTDDPFALLGSQEFIDTSEELNDMMSLTGLSIFQKDVVEPLIQLTATDTTISVSYKEWDITGEVRVSDDWVPSEGDLIALLQEFVATENIDTSEFAEIYANSGSASLSISHDDVGKLLEVSLKDFGQMFSAFETETDNLSLSFGQTENDSYAIDSNGVTAIVFKDALLDEERMNELLEEFDLFESQSGSTSASSVPITINLNDSDGTITADELETWVGLTGTAPAGSELTLVSTWDVTGGSEEILVTTAADGTWALTQDDVDGIPYDGTYALSLTARDASGTVVGTTTSEITIASENTFSNTNNLPTGSVTIAGTAIVENTFTAVTSTISDEDGLGDFNYQWFKDGLEIDGATASTFLVTQDVVGWAVSVAVSYTDGAENAESLTSLTKVVDRNVGIAFDPDLTEIFTIPVLHFAALVENDVEVVKFIANASAQLELLDNPSFNYSYFFDDFGNIITELYGDLSSIRITYGEEIVPLFDEASFNLEILRVESDDYYYDLGATSFGDGAERGEQSERLLIQLGTNDPDFADGFTSEITDQASFDEFLLSLNDLDGIAIPTDVSYGPGQDGLLNAIIQDEDGGDDNGEPTSGGLGISVVSKDGDIVTFGVFAGSSADPENDGIGSLEFSLSHNASDMLIDSDSVVFATGLSGLPNYDADTGTLNAGAFTLNNVEDLDAPLLTFEATMLDTKAPISIQIADIVVDGVDLANTTELFDFSALAITTTITDRFGNAMNSADAYAYEASNGEQFFIRQVGDDDDSTVFEIVASPGANISAIDFELTDNAGLTDFTLSDALADWSVQANTSTPNTVILSGFGAIDGSKDITAGQETVLATFTSAASPDFVISGIALNGVSQQDVSVDKITATSTTGNVTAFETANGSDILVGADMDIDSASDKAIGAFDALQALRLAVGLDKSDGTSEWHDYIAADINKDGRVGADDALNILKFAVGLTDGPSADWVFVDGNADWSAIDRSTTTYNEGIQLSDIMVDSSVDMTGILVGDVDGSYIL